METIDSQILHELQYDFPLSEKPYEVIAERLKISEEEIWGRVQIMLDKGVIRRMGASFDSNKLGFPSTLAAVSVAPEQVDNAAEVIGQFYEVTHSYLRNDAFNIWFTLIAADNKRIESILEQIRKSLNLDKSKVLNLPMKRLIRVVNFFVPVLSRMNAEVSCRRFANNGIAKRIPNCRLFAPSASAKPTMKIPFSNVKLTNENALSI